MMQPLDWGYPELFHELETLAKPGQGIFLVGGAIRNVLLNLPVHDLDFAIQGNAIQLARSLADNLGGIFFILDREHDTARTLFDRKSERFSVDFAGLRAPSLEEDLALRDFTINAIAWDMHHPETLIDPLGGARDLKDKLLRACSPSSLLDDPLRILRAVRLAVHLGMKIEKETVLLIRAAVPGLSKVSAERIRDELFLILAGEHASMGIRILDRLDALGFVLPELQDLKGVTQTAPHVLDTWEHTLATVDWLEKLHAVLAGDYKEDSASDIILGLTVLQLGRYREQLRAHFSEGIHAERSLLALVKFSALYHDIDKPGTRSEDLDGRIHFYGHEASGSEPTRLRARSLALSSAEVERACVIVENHMRIHHLARRGDQPSRRSIYRFFKAAGPAGVDIILLTLADTIATYGVTLEPDHWSRKLTVCLQLLDAWWKTPEVAVRPNQLLNGNEIMHELNLPPGKLVGMLLNALEEAQATGTVTNREEAWKYVTDRLEEIRLK